MAYSDN